MNIENYKFISKIATLPFVDAIYLYGSRARQDNSPRSDIDIAIVCPRASQTDWLKIVDYIDDADTLLTIDCVRFDSLKDNDPLKINILKQKVLLYKRE